MQHPKDPLRLAIIGLGRMGRYHARVLSSIDVVDIVAVVEPDRGAVDAAASSIADAEVFTSVDAALGRTDVEAWLIATPTPTHPQLTARALEAGLHVLCEKPLQLSPAEIDFAGTAAERNLVLQVGFWRRFSPPWAHARRLIAEGAIGAPLMLRLAQWDAHPPPPEFCDPAISGGLAIDCGVHEFDLAEWLTGRAVVKAWSRSLPLVDPAIAEVGDVDNLLAVLDLDGGAVATVDLTRNARYGDDVRTDVLGSDGAIFIELLPTGRVRLAGADGVTVIEEVADAMAVGVARQAQAFVAAVRGEAVDVPGAGASDRAVTIGRAVQHSAATGASQAID